MWVGGLVERLEPILSWMTHTQHFNSLNQWSQLVFVKIHFVCKFCFAPNQFNSVQSLSHVDSLRPPWTATRQASLSVTNSRSPPKLMSIESVMPSNHLILYCPLLLLPSIFPSIRVFSNESTLHIRWPNYWSFSFNISPSNEHPGLISFRWTGWISLQSKRLSRVFSNTIVQKHHLCSAFFTVQISHPYMTTGKTIALTRWTFIDKVISLFFNILSRLVITFLPRSKHLLISWLQSPSAVIFGAQKSATVSTVSPSICHEVMEPEALILIFWMLSFQPIFSLSSFTFINRLFSSSSLSAIRVVSKECIWISSNEMDETGVYYTERSKSGKKKTPI